MNIIQGPNPQSVGLTYFARRDPDGPIKIGCSWNQWHGRVASLAQGKRRAYPILIISGQCLELRFHAAFEPHHIGNEWFSPAPELLNTIIAIHAGAFDWNSLPNPGWCVTKPYQTKASVAHWGRLPENPGRVAA